jgi:hypothetical protein
VSQAPRSEVSRLVLQWTPWVPLQGCWRGPTIPSRPGLYRIRRIASDHLDYVGQTGLPLRQRLGMLAGLYKPEMPYRDPHTAGPALWALRHATGCDFEASVCPIDGPGPWRKGWEAVAIALYRQEHGHSPTVNFGRMPVGYRMSSGNNAKLVAAGKRFHGGLCADDDTSHLEGIPPAGPLTGDPEAAEWNGHAWSDRVLLPEGLRLLPAGGLGLYRIRGQARSGLLYVGEGIVRGRLGQHLAKIGKPGHPQGAILGNAGQLSASWVLNPAWHDHQRLELENDLIAAHLLETGRVPPAQFLGEGSRTEIG